MDGPISSKNGLSTPKKLMMKEVQVGGASVKHAEHWNAPEIVESVLKVHGSHLQEDIQQQQQKRRPATIERNCP